MYVNLRMPDGTTHRLEALEGWRVMEVIRDWGLPIKAECGGACACATCHVWVDENWVAKLAPPSDEELEMLDADDDTLEVILANAPQETLTLIEDEVLLALPFAPRCARPGCAGEPLHSEDPNMPGPSAFAALAGLKSEGRK